MKNSIFLEQFFERWRVIITIVQTLNYEVILLSDQPFDL